VLIVNSHLLGGSTPLRGGAGRRLLCGLLVVLAALLLGLPAAADQRPLWWDQAKAQAKSDGYQLLGGQGLKKLLAGKQDFVLLDVRPDYEFDAGHIKGAVNLEFHLGDRLELEPGKADTLAKLVGPDQKRLLVIYCRSFK
jgi:phage shock protein E